VRCIDCHDIHVSAKKPDVVNTVFDVKTRGSAGAVVDYVPETKVKVRPPSETIESCLKCHQTQRGEISLPYHHPLREAKITCIDCHDPHGGRGDKNLRASNVNQLCLTCHAQYRGPFAYQHPPVNENCLNCHTPHGSPNTNLLRLSEPALCLQCHAGHHNGANLPLMDRCTDCHGSIHGTDVPTATGGSRFVDKGPYGVPLQPPQPAVATGGVPRLQPSHPSFAHAAPMASAAAGVLSAFGPGGINGGSDGPQAGSSPGETFPGAYSAYSVTPASYRFADTTGFAGRVGEYDSLDNSAGAELQSAYISPDHQATLVTRGDVVTGNDYRFASQLLVASHVQAGLNVNSFVQQQDTYPFYSSIISPDISVTDTIPAGSAYGVVRRLGNAYARVNLPKVPVRLSVFGNWQARSGLSQFRYLDEGGDPDCGSCHYNSQYQQLNYTTRNVGGAVDVNIKQAQVTYRHEFSSFNDRLTFPTGSYGAMLNGQEPGPIPVGDTAPGNYYLNIPSPNQAHTDSLNLNWTASPSFALNGYIAYGRLANTFLSHRQNTFNSDESARWRPIKRVMLQFDYHQNNLVNDFTPFYSYFGNVSHHQYKAGGRIGYEIASGLEIETYYYRSGITRSNSQLWPQIYSIDNTDLLTVVPSTTSNITGTVLGYHHGAWSARAGYEWTGTDNPGYLIVPGSNNRLFTNLTLAPSSWLMFTNDFSALIQNAFPMGLRRNRLYSSTTAATFRIAPGWNLQVGHSYQQNDLNNYIAFQNDAGANYVIDEPLVPYKQISQTYWGQTGYTVANKFGLAGRVSYNSARSGFRPNLDPNNAVLFGNASLIQQGTFDPVLFQQALDALQYGATQVSEVVVPQWIGESKAYYMFPHKFNAGVVIYYGSYRDAWNPQLNGVLRTFSIYAGRTW
jgi:predicted CXXCH cytochrome family protein